MTGSGRLRILAAALLPLLALGGGALLLGQVVTERAASNAVPSYEPRELEPQGDFVHPTAGFVLPETVGEFRRVQVTQYDAAARNFSAGYVRAVEGGTVWPISATVYVYPAKDAGDIDESFTRLLADIGRHHAGAVPDFRKKITLSQGRFAGRYAAFGWKERFFGVKLPLRSYVVLYRWQDWWVKWRVTTPASKDGEPIRAFLKLTETLVPPGGRSGRAEPLWANQQAADRRVPTPPAAPSRRGRRRGHRPALPPGSSAPRPACPLGHGTSCPTIGPPGPGLAANVERAHGVCYRLGGPT